jgi:hypothetical protein
MAKKRRDGTALGNFSRAYQGHISAAFVFCVLACRFAGGAYSSIATKMTSLSYPTGDGRYGAGGDDVYLIGFVATFFIFVRYILQLLIFNRIADSGKCDRDKFTMQGWQFSYYLTAWVWGFVEYYHSDYWLDMGKLFVGYPHLQLSPSFKLYYIFQISFWIQMVFVTLIEKWQKDFIPMMMHHFITIFLCASSYAFNFTWTGHVILVEQDLGDIFLPLAKMFKYFVDAASTRVGRNLDAPQPTIFAPAPVPHFLLCQVGRAVRAQSGACIFESA